jgi:hypothetical protein|tara:strand:- start:374 stop:610 length:237 start_codon:yes stop_codon:yes gene_type:complete
MLDKLQKYAMIIGVVSAIGGGFYAWGEFNTRLNAVSQAVGSDNVEKLQQQVNLLDKKLEVLEAKLNEFRSGFNNPLGK